MENTKTFPLISVIMPNYNGAQLIARSIDSVLTQTLDSLELLIVDDGSTDESTNIITSYGDKRIHLLQQDHQGVCAARNLALSQSRGKFIAFLDSDDTWAPKFLEKLTAALNETPDAALAYCGWQNVGLEGKRGDPFIPPDYETPDKLTLWLQNCRWPIHAALTRRHAILSVGGFDSRFPTSEDFLLWLRIVTRERITLVSEVLAFYFHHEGPRATTDQVRLAFNHLNAQQHYLQENPDARNSLGQRRIRELIFGVMLKRGYECYWRGDLVSARRIFRRAMTAGYGSLKDWKYMLPSLLPLSLHRRLINQHTVKEDS